LTWFINAMQPRMRPIPIPACNSTKPARMRAMNVSLGSARTNASGTMTSRMWTEKVRVPSSATNLVSPESSTPAAAQGTIAIT